VAGELRLGTRGSQLARWQADAVAARLQEAGGPACRLVVIRTTGDRLQEAPLSEVGGKRLFVKEIEDALLKNEIDIAVHSSKDMPVLLPDGLAIGAVLAREDPFDALVMPLNARLASDAPFEGVLRVLGSTPMLGTSSVRRVAQLTRLLPDARFVPIRGNLDTRLRKLDEGQYDAIVLAAAGLRRLGMAGRISARLPASACVPAPGQGIVAVEIRETDKRAADAVHLIDDSLAHAALDAERAVVQALGGGCQTPVGALALPAPEGSLELTAVVVSLDGSRALYATGRGKREDAASLGGRVGAQLLADGAGAILADAQRVDSAAKGTQP
jgi:hydroxymethylbilane synthase